VAPYVRAFGYCAARDGEVGFAYGDSVTIARAVNRPARTYSMPETVAEWAFDAQTIVWVGREPRGSHRTLEARERSTRSSRELLELPKPTEVVATHAALAVQGDEVYFTGELLGGEGAPTPSGSGLRWEPTHALYRVSKKGGRPVALARTYLQPTMLVMSGSIAMVASNAFEDRLGVSRLDATTGTEERTAYYGGYAGFDPPAAVVGAPFAIAVTGGFAYWALRGWAPTGRTDSILRTPITGGAIETLRSVPARHVHGVEGIDGRAYYAMDGAIRRVDDDGVVVRTGETVAARFARADDGWLWCDPRRGLFGRAVAR
jgi:hypothetical protein